MMHLVVVEWFRKSTFSLLLSSSAVPHDSYTSERPKAATPAKELARENAGQFQGFGEVH